MHTTDSCRRGTLSVTPAVLMCGTEASLSPGTDPVCAAFEIADCGGAQHVLTALPPPTNEYYRLWCFQSIMKDISSCFSVTQNACTQLTAVNFVLLLIIFSLLLCVAVFGFNNAAFPHHAVVYNCYWGSVNYVPAFFFCICFIQTSKWG